MSQAIYTWYTDGSSFLHKGARRAGYAIMSDTEVVEAQALPAHTTHQQAELIALTRAFQLVQGRSLNIYTDSKYAFHILLSHTTIWKERGLLTTKGGSVTNANQIMTMLKASHLPTSIGIAHCRSHQNFKGNNRADEAARTADLRDLDLSHPPQDIITLQPTSPRSPTDT